MPIEAAGEFSFEDMLRGSILLGRAYLLKSMVIGVIFLVGGISLVVSTNDWSDWTVLIVAGAIILILPWLLLVFRSHKAAKSMPVLNGPVRYRFDSEGMHFQGPHSQGALKWTGILRYTEDKHTFLFYTASKQGSTVPKRFFSNTSDIKAVRELIRREIPRKR